jgi:2-polyprenyl-3-methyl-5-hydroxy-6-metoxy-1,4-benzoquinol methylase
MTAEEVSYTLDNTWEKAHRRLTLLESILDPQTIRRLTGLGVGPGWRCLELGAGAGSIARWLCDHVGPTGKVTAVDLEPRFLKAAPRPNLEILRRDVVADGVPGAGYDLIHARALLMHLPTRDELIADLVGRLRPGGAILLEEGDASSFATAESAAFVELWEACCAVAAKTGGDWYWAHRMPARLAAAGVTGVTAVAEYKIVPGGTLSTEFLALSWEQLTPLLLAEGFAADQIAAATAELSDPARWFPFCALVAAWGHCPA